MREPPEGPSKGSRAGTWASRLGVHLWEPCVLRATVLDKRRDGHESAHCPQPPGAGGRPGACVHACVHVWVCRQRHASLCARLSVHTHACVYAGMYVCTHVHARTTKHAYTHELHCVSMQVCAHTCVHICMCIHVNQMCGSGVGLCAPMYLVCEHVVCSSAHVRACVGVHV